MKRILRRICTFVGALVITFTLIGWGLGYYRYQQSSKLPDKIAISIDFNAPLRETAEHSALSSFVDHEETIEVADMVRLLDRARRDGRVKGIIARFGGSEPTLAHAQEVREALRRFHDSGKFMIAFAPSFGEMTPADKSYYLAAQFNEIWLQPGGIVGLSGIGISMPFLRGLLDQYGVKPEVMTRKAYKTAMASLTDKGFTPQHREMMDQLLDTLYGQLVEGIASGRNLPADKVRNLIDNGPYTTAEAIEKKLVDKIAYSDEALAEAMKRAGDGNKDDGHLVHWADYMFATSQRPVKEIPEPAADDKQVALINITGIIHQGQSMQSPFGGFESAGADTIMSALDAARDNDDVKAVVLRIDSPGGSPAASESIRRAILRVAEKNKPVIVSMGATAASGGYWVATGASHIIAEPATLTGSIGVVAGKMNFADLLRRFNVNIETLKRGQHADMWSPTSSFSASDRTRMDAMLDQVYGDFKTRVMEARKLDAATAERVAQGRVWTGEEALKLKLIDEIGGQSLAMRNAKQAMGIDADTPVRVVVLPQPPSPTEQLMQFLQMTMNGGVAIGQLGTALNAIAPFKAMLAPQGIVQMPYISVN